MEQTLVSIIIPTFNYGRYVKCAIDSCLIQKHDGIDIETIVIDDGSTDNTFYQIKDYIVSKSIRYERTKNMGVANARNLGIELCHGDYIIFLDADDYLTEDLVKTQLACSDRNDSNTISICQSIQVKEDRENSTQRGIFMRPLFKDSIEGHICFNNIATQHSYFISKNIVKNIKFKDNVYFSEDYEYILQCMKKSPKICINPYGFVVYRNHSGSRSKCEIYKEKSNSDLFNSIEEYISSINDDATARKAKLAVAARYTKEYGEYQDQSYIKKAKDHISSITSLNDNFEKHYFALYLINMLKNNSEDMSAIKSDIQGHVNDFCFTDIDDLKRIAHDTLKNLCIDNTYISAIQNKFYTSQFVKQVFEQTI